MLPEKLLPASYGEYFHDSLMPGSVYIVAGRPGMGHQGFVDNLARRAVGADRSVIWLASERSSFACRDLSNEHKKKIVFDDTIVHTEKTLRACVKTAVALLENGAYGRLGLIVVDSIQSVVAEGAYRRLKPDTGLTALRRIAEKYGAPVVALSSLPRRIEKRKDKQPRLSDLDSAVAHELVDGVIFLYNESMYNGGIENGDFQIYFAKNRHGLLGGFGLKASDQESYP